MTEEALDHKGLFSVTVVSIWWPPNTYKNVGPSILMLVLGFGLYSSGLWCLANLCFITTMHSIRALHIKLFELEWPTSSQSETQLKRKAGLPEVRIQWCATTQVTGGL